MPRPVVPILALPRYRSRHLSSATWCGMIRCALAEISSRSQETPGLRSRTISSISTAGSMTTPLPMTRRRVFGQDSGRQQVQRVALVADDDGVPGVVAALVPDDVVHAVAEQSVALPLPSSPHWAPNNHDGGHGYRLASGSSGAGELGSIFRPRDEPVLLQAGAICQPTGATSPRSASAAVWARVTQELPDPLDLVLLADRGGRPRREDEARAGSPGWARLPGNRAITPPARPAEEVEARGDSPSWRRRRPRTGSLASARSAKSCPRCGVRGDLAATGRRVLAVGQRLGRLGVLGQVSGRRRGLRQQALVCHAPILPPAGVVKELRTDWVTTNRASRALR